MTKHYLQKSLKKGKENIDKQWESYILVWIQSKMVWRLIIVNRIILLLDNLLLLRFLTYSPSKRSITSSPPSPFNLNLISEERRVSMQFSNIKKLYSRTGNFHSEPWYFTIILFQHGHYLISARISYFSTKYEKKIWTLWQQIDLFSNEIYIITTHNKHIKRAV